MGDARPRPVVLDAGALIEFDRGDPRVRALVRLALDAGVALIVPAGALAQAWRDGSRQARLAAVVGSEGVEVAVLDEATAKAAGALCGRAATADVVDASVVLAARARHATVVSGDPEDLRHLDPELRIEAL